MKSCLSKHIKMVALLLGSQGADFGFTADKDWLEIEYDKELNEYRTIEPLAPSHHSNDNLKGSTSAQEDDAKHTENDPYSINKDAGEAMVPSKASELSVSNTTNVAMGAAVNSNKPLAQPKKDDKINNFWFKGDCY